MSVNAIVSTLQTEQFSFRQICEMYNITMTDLNDIVNFMVEMESNPFEPRADDYMEMEDE
jgi:hypothetical protein